jgi:hypothetical protein
MRTTQFDKHKLIQMLMPITRDFISRQAPDKIINNPTEKEKRARDILLSANNITECIDQIHFTIELLSGFRNKKNGKMNRYDYIVYMIENFYFRITSIFDRALQFSNLIFEIGLPEKECRESTIIRNDKIKETPVEKSLSGLNKFTNEYRFIRNQVAHLKRFDVKELSIVEGFYYLLETEESIKFLQYENLYKKKIDQYVIRKKKEFKEIAKQTEKLVHEFFDTMVPYVKVILDKY